MSLCSRLRESVGAGASDIDWLMFQPTERNVRSPLISLPLTEKRKERDRVRKHRSKKCQTKFKHPWLRWLTNRRPSVLMLPWQTVAVGWSGRQSLCDFNLFAGATQICQRKTFHSKNLSIELLCFNRMTSAHGMLFMFANMFLQHYLDNNWKLSVASISIGLLKLRLDCLYWIKCISIRASTML